MNECLYSIGEILLMGETNMHIEKPVLGPLQSL